MTEVEKVVVDLLAETAKLEQMQKEVADQAARVLDLHLKLEDLAIDAKWIRRVNGRTTKIL